MSDLTRREQFALAIIAGKQEGFSETCGPSYAQELASEVELILAELDKGQPPKAVEENDIEAFNQFWKRYNESAGDIDASHIWISALAWERGGRK